jgi:hypothetical protein
MATIVKNPILVHLVLPAKIFDGHVSTKLKSEYAKFEEAGFYAVDERKLTISSITNITNSRTTRSDNDRHEPDPSLPSVVAITCFIHIAR